MSYVTQVQDLLKQQYLNYVNDPESKYEDYLKNVKDIAEQHQEAFSIIQEMNTDANVNVKNNSMFQDAVTGYDNTARTIFENIGRVPYGFESSDTIGNTYGLFNKSNDKIAVPAQVPDYAIPHEALHAMTKDYTGDEYTKEEITRLADWVRSRASGDIDVQEATFKALKQERPDVYGKLRMGDAIDMAKLNTRSLQMFRELKRNGNLDINEEDMRNILESGVDSVDVGAIFNQDNFNEAALIAPYSSAKMSNHLFFPEVYVDLNRTGLENELMRKRTNALKNGKDL